MRPRVIPILLIHNQRLVKTVRFKEETYVGDPINAVKIFNEKEVDELIILDIGATAEKTPIDWGMISNLANECFMPFCYGGGVRSVDDFKKILSIGVEKVSINTAAIENVTLISDMAKHSGSQSVVASIDVKKDWLGRYRVFGIRGKKNTALDPVHFAKELENRGAGEILVNSVDRDGTYEGYDTHLIQKVSESVRIPVIACGGAKNVDNLKEVLHNGASAAAAGSLFVFYGVHRAVLINYPSAEVIGSLL